MEIGEIGVWETSIIDDQVILWKTWKITKCSKKISIIKTEEEETNEEVKVNKIDIINLLEICALFVQKETEGNERMWITEAMIFEVRCRIEKII